MDDFGEFVLDDGILDRAVDLGEHRRRSEQDVGIAGLAAAVVGAMPRRKALHERAGEFALTRCLGAENQCEGGVIDGLSTMMGLELSIEQGRVQESNFDRYPILRMGRVPDVTVHFIQSDHPPTGLGEPALPPLAPAICNAIYAASGHRVKTLPLSREGFSV